MIDVSNGKVHVAESCLEETGGLGVDIVIDAGGGYLGTDPGQEVGTWELSSLCDVFS